MKNSQPANNSSTRLSFVITMTNPQEAVYIEYLNYDWESFTEFQEGLAQILENYLENLKQQDPSVTSIPSLDRQQLIEQAKSFFYCSHTGNILELDDYNQWKLHNEQKYLKNKKIVEIEIDDNESQEKNHDDESQKKSHDEIQNKSHDDETQQKSHDESEPPYSSNYKELVQLILAGKEVPGIKQIPNTILPDKVSKSTKTQRVKPWENN